MTVERRELWFWLIGLVIVVGITVTLILIGRSGSKYIKKVKDDKEDIKMYEEF
jgi:hypothetical protein